MYMYIAESVVIAKLTNFQILTLLYVVTKLDYVNYDFLGRSSLEL